MKKALDNSLIGKIKNLCSLPFDRLQRSNHHAVVGLYDDVAELYDSVRPGYSVETVDLIANLAGLHQDSCVLEIGCGTGKATSLFAERQFKLQCLEPSDNMANVARRKIAAFPRSEVHTTTFEKWKCPNDQFDLVFAAQSFHWLDKVQRLRHIAQMLKDKGSLAIFGNVSDLSANKANEAIHQAHVRYAPSIIKRDYTAEAYSSENSPIYAELKNSPLFDNVRFETFNWQENYSANTYTDLLNTFSEYLALPQQNKLMLFRDIQEAIDMQGGTLTINYLTGLFFAQKKAKVV